ncbi:uncharacterized protein LOC116340902 [Contarinia nasturtii]|uniref:uncharacterized protein LOC116340902 n=1 Tax=Contarinia nasturtii TaxID=265458 RepID=UPI0012D38488|nr:uncharacterized protein LOC116340902 [Contarinia nasturtii]
MKQFLFLTLFSFLAFDGVFIKEAMGQTTYQQVIDTFQLNSHAGIDWPSRLEPVFSLDTGLAYIYNAILDSLTNCTMDQEVLALRDAVKNVPELTDYLSNNAENAFNNWKQEGHSVRAATESILSSQFYILTNFQKKCETAYLRALNKVQLEVPNYSQKYQNIRKNLRAANKALDDFIKRREMWVNFLMGYESALQ